MLKDMIIEYRELKADEISRELFRRFKRYQKVTKRWEKENAAWLLKKVFSIENWSEEDFAYLVKCLKHTIEAGGAVCGAFGKETLVGFFSVEKEPFGERRGYVQLSSIHVSYEHRGCGIGRQLFLMAADKARQFGGRKLYISAQSSEETQAFYKSMRCSEALEYKQSLTKAEPADCQLEYIL